MGWRGTLWLAWNGGIGRGRAVACRLPGLLATGAAGYWGCRPLGLLASPPTHTTVRRRLPCHLCNAPPGAHLLLRGYLFGHTLSVMQFAKAAVYSYPCFPDATALLTVLAEAHGRTAAQKP